MNLILIGIQHATPADGSWWSLVEILNFENENKIFGYFDPLAIAETEIPIII